MTLCRSLPSPEIIKQQKITLQGQIISNKFNIKKYIRSNNFYNLVFADVSTYLLVGKAKLVKSHKIFEWA